MAGKRLFCNRRWLNPTDPIDRENLERSYDALTSQFPAFARCPRNDFLQILAEVCTAASSERVGNYRAASFSPSTEPDHRDEALTPESTRPPPSFTGSRSSASCSPALPALAVGGGRFDAIDAAQPIAAAAAAAAWEFRPASTPARSYVAAISLENDIARASSADTDPGWASDRDAPAKRRRAGSPPCVAAAAAAAGEDAGLAAWLALAWTAGGGGAGLNAGEAVDMGLYARWASVPTLRVDPADLERFGRSADSEPL
jgi:hypothetical protein